jgi:transcriptional regulator with PAS, ATPase and Fis domain
MPSHALSQSGQAPKGGSGASWSATYSFADIIGHSPALLEAQDLARRAASAECPILLHGETGTGKELFAHATHTAGPRHNGPFVPIDCASVPAELLETELFGYAPGAFSGATKEGKPGKFELAQGGTIFLDEIGEMPIEMQAKLLRVLQEHQIIRVGGVAPIAVDFVVIAATNRDLQDMVSRGTFRSDLMYRLEVMRIDIPPLRQRPGDIRPLVEYYWDLSCQRFQKSVQLSGEALRMLEAYGWPGNVRELENVVQRLILCASKPVTEPDDLPATIRHGPSDDSLDASRWNLASAIAQVERQTLSQALQHVHGNRLEAARLVGLSRASFYRKLKEYGITN